tara:strand:+ start:2084 stop:2362 length:279 start_codon:yes stop_codon:yes gene_type:complete
MESELRLDLIIVGRVQGVGYRDFTKKKADSLSITGSVKNMRDGTVLVTAQGGNEAMGNFLKWCYKGPKGAIVRKIDKVKGQTEDFNGFIVIY